MNSANSVMFIISGVFVVLSSEIILLSISRSYIRRRLVIPCAGFRDAATVASVPVEQWDKDFVPGTSQRCFNWRVRRDRGRELVMCAGRRSQASDAIRRLATTFPNLVSSCILPRDCFVIIASRFLVTFMFQFVDLMQLIVSILFSSAVAVAPFAFGLSVCFVSIKAGLGNVGPAGDHGSIRLPKCQRGSSVYRTIGCN